MMEVRIGRSFKFKLSTFLIVIILFNPSIVVLFFERFLVDCIKINFFPKEKFLDFVELHVNTKSPIPAKDKIF